MKQQTFQQIGRFIPAFAFASWLFPNSIYTIENLSPKVQQAIEIIRQQKNFPFCAKIVQKLNGPKGFEKRKGLYCAKAGKFKAKFYVPHETIVFNGKKIYWKIKGNPFTWTLSAEAMHFPSPNHALPKEILVIKELKPNFWEKLFHPNLQKVSIMTAKNPTRKLVVTLDLTLPAIVQRVLLNQYGQVLIREKYANPIRIHNKIFFRTVQIEMAGKIPILNETVYSEITAYPKLSKDYFQPPAGPYKEFHASNQ
ncbi:MAG: hypothetical protein D6767_00305 [Candidatus Hydrogenedentota bacterium]|nr:MAG: hypothetical protein D6767_00305 [Candidatus Hydrogenedentota bacterium]